MKFSDLGPEQQKVLGQFTPQQMTLTFVKGSFSGDNIPQIDWDEIPVGLRTAILGSLGPLIRTSKARLGVDAVTDVMLTKAGIRLLCESHVGPWAVYQEALENIQKRLGEGGRHIVLPKDTSGGFRQSILVLCIRELDPSISVEGDIAYKACEVG